MNQKWTVLVVVLLLALLFGCTSNQTPEGMVKVAVTVTDDTNYVMFSQIKDINAGLNAFDAVKQIVGESNMSYKKYDFGVFIDGFLGKKAPSTHFWSLYVNGKKAESGISNYSVDFDTNLDWKLEKIETYP